MFSRLMRKDKEDWWAGTLVASDAEHALASQPSGNFLVRQEDDNSEHLFLSVAADVGPMHFKLSRKDRGFEFGGQSFSSIPKLVKFLKTQGLKSKRCGHILLKTAIGAEIRSRPIEVEPEEINTSVADEIPTIQPDRSIPSLTFDDASSLMSFASGGEFTIASLLEDGSTVLLLNDGGVIYKIRITKKDGTYCLDNHRFDSLDELSQRVLINGIKTESKTFCLTSRVTLDTLASRQQNMIGQGKNSPGRIRITSISSSARVGHTVSDAGKHPSAPPPSQAIPEDDAGRDVGGSKGSAKSSPDLSGRLAREEWYAGRVSREDALDFLMTEGNQGEYFVHQNLDKKNVFYLSCLDQRSVAQYKIAQAPDGRFYFGDIVLNDLKDFHSRALKTGLQRRGRVLYLGACIADKARRHFHGAKTGTSLQLSSTESSAPSRSRPGSGREKNVAAAQAGQNDTHAGTVPGSQPESVSGSAISQSQPKILHNAHVYEQIEEEETDLKPTVERGSEKKEQPAASSSGIRNRHENKGLFSTLRGLGGKLGGLALGDKKEGHSKKAKDARRNAGAGGSQAAVSATPAAPSSGKGSLAGHKPIIPPGDSSESDSDDDDHLIDASEVLGSSSSPRPNKKAQISPASPRSGRPSDVADQDDPLPPVPSSSASSGPASQASSSLLSPMDIERFVLLPERATDVMDLPPYARDRRLNRFRNVLPNPLTRVDMSKLANDVTTTYINANFVRGHGNNTAKAYIAAQAPRDSGIFNFVRMIFDYKVVAVIMATGIVENGKNKCVAYWPRKTGETMRVSHGNHTIVIKKLDEEKLASCVKSVVDITFNRKTHTFHHFWYDEWRDHSVPQDSKGNMVTKNLLDMLLAVRDFRQAADGGKAPLLVHCSAGIGRTGTIIAIDHGMHALDAGRSFNVVRTISELREDRMAMVQHISQYKYIYQALSEYAARIQTEKNADTSSLTSSRSNIIYAVVKEDIASKALEESPGWKLLGSEGGRKLYEYTQPALREDDADFNVFEEEELEEDDKGQPSSQPSSSASSRTASPDVDDMNGSGRGTASSPSAEKPPATPKAPAQQNAKMTSPWQPSKRPEKDPDDPASYDWFKSNYTREQVEEVLTNKPVGTFVVRKSNSRADHYAMSVQDGTKVANLLLVPVHQPDGSRGYKLGEHGEDTWPSVPTMVAYLKQQGLASKADDGWVQLKLVEDRPLFDQTTADA